MKTRILLLSTSLGMGGADRQILYLANALLRHDYDVRLVSMTPLEEMGRMAVTLLTRIMEAAGQQPRHGARPG